MPDLTDRTRGKEITMTEKIRKVRMGLVLFSLLCLLQLLPAYACAEQAEDSGELLTLRFSGFVFPGEYETEIAFSDNWFLQDASQYCHPLARLSMGASIASFRWDFQDDPESYEDIARFYRQMGFDHISLGDYEKDPSLFTIASCIGSKEITAGDESFTLVAVTVCGGNYSSEWASNLTIGEGERHEGFDTAAELVEDRVTGYLAREKLLNREIKLWVSGFSRAAGVANIVGADLTDMELCPASDIFVYTFATPRVTRGDTGNYTNIFNIIGKQDPIPRFSPGDWGFGRYGRGLYTPSQETDSDYPERAAKAAEVFEKLIGREWWNNPGSNLDLRLLYDYFIYAFPEQGDYVKVLQEPLASLVDDKSIGNVVRQLGNILSSKEIPKAQRGAVRDFMKYLLGMVAGDAMELGEQSLGWRRGALTSGNVVHEHCLEVYLAWLLSSDDPGEIYTENEDWIRLRTVGSGEYIVTEHESGRLVEDWLADGEALGRMSAVLPGITYGENYGEYDFYYVWDDETFEQVLILPNDWDYDVWFLSDMDQTVPVTAVWFPSFLEKDMRFREQTISVSEGEIVRVLDARELVEELSAEESGKSSISPDDETELLQFEEGKRLGSKVLRIVLAAAVVILCMVILLLWLLVHSARKRKRSRTA